MKTEIRAYAKINLFLDVTGIRDDGYHDVETVMQSVSLFDTVEVELLDDERITIECDKEGVPLDEKNIAHKAARLFFDRANIKKGVRITIKKNIPMAAGLAGGSADGAAVLVGLNGLCNNAFSKEELCKMGASLGADVPFCVACGSMYSDGRGDNLKEFASIPSNTCLVIACGGEGVSTPWAYGMLDKDYNNFAGYKKRGVKALYEKIVAGDISFCDELFNLFEATVSRERPVVSEIKEIIEKHGARRAMMSGSGPSVFGVFANVKDAERASNEILKKGYFSCVAYPIFERK